MEQVERKTFAEFVEEVQFVNASFYQDKLLIADMQYASEDKVDFHPVQLDAFAFILVERGELVVDVDYKTFRVRENMFLVSIEKHIVQPISASHDFKGYHLIVTHDFTRSATSERPPVVGYVPLPLQSSPAICLNTIEFVVLRNNLERLRYHIQRNKHAYQSKLVQNALADLLYEIWNCTMLRFGEEVAEQKSTFRNTIIADFFDLLFKNAKREHTVAFYAEKLCVTPVYLSRAVKCVTGKPAMKIINDVVLSEAMILLRKSDLTIQRIAEELNFADQASFSKFFKKSTGKAPLLYRRIAYSF